VPETPLCFYRKQNKQNRRLSNRNLSALTSGGEKELPLQIHPADASIIEGSDRRTDRCSLSLSLSLSRSLLYYEFSGKIGTSDVELFLRSNSEAIQDGGAISLESAACKFVTRRKIEREREREREREGERERGRGREGGRERI
jgi:hypothetical protein